MENIDSKIRKLATLRNQITEELLEQVRKLALEHLKDESNTCNEFVLGMGTYFFTDQTTERQYGQRCEKLDRFMDKYSYRFSLTGEAMRFKSDGKVTTNW